MRFRVGFGRRLEFGGTLYSAGDEFEAPDAATAGLLATRLVIPLDELPEGFTPVGPASPPQAVSDESSAPDDGPCNSCSPAKSTGKRLEVTEWLDGFPPADLSPWLRSYSRG